jgi:hypothetical protein
MKKLICASVLAASFASGVDAAPKSFSSMEFGFETISYREDIDFLLGRKLSQDSTIVNPIQHTLSYTALEDKDWGFYIESTSTLFENYESEEWTLQDYGQIQTNDMLMRSIDVKVQGAYTLSRRSQLLAGVSLFVLDFTRSNFVREAGGDTLHADVIGGAFDALHTPAQLALENCEDIPRGADVQAGKGFCPTLGAVSEAQNSVEFLLGYIYDTNLGLSRKFSWFAQGEVALPIWHRTTNSNLPAGITLDEFGGGWGFNTRAGLRWSVTEKANITLGAGASFKTRDKVEGEDQNGGYIAVPSIDYTNIQVFAGLMWYI